MHHGAVSVHARSAGEEAEFSGAEEGGSIHASEHLAAGKGEAIPAASEDVEAVYRELLKEYQPEHIGIFGCSAGGGLTAQAVAWFQSKALSRPRAVGIFAAAPMPPWLHGNSAT